MKKTLLSSLLTESSKMDKGELESFYERAEPNPFLGAKKKRRGGLDKLVRDIDDLEDEYSDIDWIDDHIKDDDDDNLMYVAPHKQKHYKRNEFNQERDIDDIDMDAGREFMRNLEPEETEFDDEDFDTDFLNAQDEDPTDDEDIEDNEEEDDEFSDLDPEIETGDGRYQGIVRAVKGAYLVSKTQQPDETFTEIWMYNVGEKYEDEANIRKAILSATDIDPTKGFSEDGSQEAFMKTVGNVQFLTISGIPN